MQITKEFLTGIGFEVEKENPLYTTFQHSNRKRVFCRIGKYGEFSILELHWLNLEIEREFTTTNAKLTTDDFYKIISLANITL